MCVDLTPRSLHNKYELKVFLARQFQRLETGGVNCPCAGRRIRPDGDLLSKLSLAPPWPATELHHAANSRFNFMGDMATLPLFIYSSRAQFRRGFEMLSDGGDKNGLWAILEQGAK